VNAKLLDLEKFPYLLTLLVGLIGWGLTHIVDRLIGSPIIEYSISKDQNQDTLQLAYEIHNINRSKKFNDVDFLLRTDVPTNKFIQAHYRINPPMKIDETNDKFYYDSSFYEARIKQFQPDFCFKIIIKKLGKEVTPLRISSASPVKLTESCWETYLLKNEFHLIFFLILLWLLMLMIYIVRIKTT
jgi:hypothetical protein